MRLDRYARQLRSTVTRDVRLAVRAATQRAVEACKEATPPPKGARRGVNTVTGDLAANWGATAQYMSCGDYIIHLINKKQYAGYVDAGHKMVRHFVPWLYIDDSGLISRHLPSPGEGLFGLVVGTRTTYIPPTNMSQAGIDTFARVLREQLSNTPVQIIGG